MLQASTLVQSKVSANKFASHSGPFLPFFPRASPPLSTYVMAALYPLGDAECFTGRPQSSITSR